MGMWLKGPEKYSDIERDVLIYRVKFLEILYGISRDREKSLI